MRCLEGLAHSPLRRQTCNRHRLATEGIPIVLDLESSARQTWATKRADYYHRSRTHLRLQKDTPETRPVQPPEAGRIISIPEVGGLHHRYERRAA
jgi:hypothetical protein